MSDLDDLAELEMNLTADKDKARKPLSAKVRRHIRRLIVLNDEKKRGKGGEARRAACVKITLVKINLPPAE